VSELLLELLSEEIPAWMQPRAIESLTGSLRAKLAAAEIPAESVRGYVTPRRLAVVAEGILAVQPDRTEERRGPRVGAPQPAIAGFLRSAGIAEVTECEIRDTDRGKFYFAVVNRPGRPAREVLPELILGAMAELPWAKSMRYPASDLRWVRPLNSVLCLFDGQVLPLPLGRVPVGRTTRGHRFLAPDEICVTSAADYVQRLGKARVVLDQDRRKEMIREDLEEAAAAKGLRLSQDPTLLEEVVGLIELPVVLMGSIDAAFMTLPREVLATAMRSHQKYFSCRYPDSTPAPHFLFVANNLAADAGKTIIAGNERVLRARLADARFFWDQDLKVPLESRVDTLKERVFHDRLGSVYDKAERMTKLAEFLAPHVRGADTGRAGRAAQLAKADLSTGMVAEFPELQGIMGGYYYERQHLLENDDVQKQAETAAIAQAIADHYRPLGPGDSCPKASDSIVVALADKIDTLVAFFAVALPPTGSQDPFALRRAALGVIRVIIDNNVRLPLKDTLTTAAEIFYKNRDPDHLNYWQSKIISDLYPELIVFIVDRLRVHLREQGVRHDLIAAASVQARGFPQMREHEDDLLRLMARVDALRTFLASQDGADLLIAYRRAANIVAIEEKKDRRRYDDRPPNSDPGILVQSEERALDASLRELLTAPELASEDFSAAMAVLARLRDPVDAFFDKVTVNADEAPLRENRLRLLAAIRATMNQIADFSQIEG
jgi:glycyl-tRNA synthetase beta chain